MVGGGVGGFGGGGRCQALALFEEVYQDWTARLGEKSLETVKAPQTRARAHAHARTLTHMHARSRTCTHMHARSRTCTLTHVRAHVRTYAHAHAHARTNAPTRVGPLPDVRVTGLRGAAAGAQAITMLGTCNSRLKGPAAALPWAQKEVALREEVSHDPPPRTAPALG